MLTNLRKILGLFMPQERRQGMFLLLLILVMALLDMIGVASVMPFISVLSNPQAIESNRYLAAAYQLLGFSAVDDFLFFLGVIVFVTLIGAIAFKALTTYALLRFTEMRNFSLGQRLIGGYLYQPYAWFLNRHSADLGKTVLSEVNQVITGTLIPMLQLIAHGAVTLALLSLLIIVDPRLAFSVVAALGGAYAIIYMVLRRYLGRIGADRVRANRERYQIVQEAFGGIKDVKVLGLEQAMLERYKGPSERFARRQAGSQLASTLPRFAMEAITFGGILVVVLYLMRSHDGLQQALPVLAVYAFAGYRLMPALQNIYTQMTKMRFSSPALDALHRDMEQLGGETHDAPVASAAPMALTESLKLDAVVYAYPGTDHTVLDGLSLAITARTTVGLVGSTGSGKTTTVDLILGLLQAQAGGLVVDGVKINRDNLRSWQRSIGYVPQSIYLSDDSVAANIAFGIPAAQIDQAAVERAARIANLHDFVTRELPQGYATLVGERGVRLSGGQRQRIGIARALYHDPEVLILDEATSALDNLTEQAVMEAVHHLGHRKTIILIAHRLTTVRECDNIFVLEKGRVIAQGEFTTLIDKCEQFRKMAEGM